MPGKRRSPPDASIGYTEKTAMYYLVLFVHVIVCIFLIIVILLQSGKAADLAGAFGGMGSQTAFGPRGSATLLSKATTISAVLFMITSMSLSIMATKNAGLGATVLEERTPSKAAPGKTAPAPATPAAPGTGQPQTAPITVTPEGGKPTTIQVPVVPSNPAPAQPAQPGLGQKQAPASPKK
jgi:preprotein translocase subunit SecG